MKKHEAYQAMGMKMFPSLQKFLKFSDNEARKHHLDLLKLMKPVKR